MGSVPTPDEIIEVANEIVDLAYDMRAEEWMHLDFVDRDKVDDGAGFTPSPDLFESGDEQDKVENEFRATGEFDDIPNVFRQFTKGNIGNLEEMCDIVQSSKNILDAEADELSDEDKTGSEMGDLAGLMDTWGGEASANFKEAFAAPFPQLLINHLHILRWLARDLTAAKDMLVEKRTNAYQIAVNTRNAMQKDGPDSVGEIALTVTKALVDIVGIGKASKAEEKAGTTLNLAFESFKYWLDGDGADFKTHSGPPTRTGGATVEMILDHMMESVNALVEDISEAEKAFEDKIDADMQQLEEILDTEGSKGSSSRYIRPEKPMLVGDFSPDDFTPP